MTPYNKVYKAVERLGNKIGDTTDYVDEDMGGKSFPFIYIGESKHEDLPYIERSGLIRQTIHIYATNKQREHADYMLHAISLGLKVDVEAEGLTLYRPEVEYETLDLVEGNQRLIHHVIEYKVRYIIKEEI